jgi:hypothetical protein
VARSVTAPHAPHQIVVVLLALLIQQIHPNERSSCGPKHASVPSCTKMQLEPDYLAHEQNKNNYFFHATLVSDIPHAQRRAFASFQARTKPRGRSVSSGPRRCGQAGGSPLIQSLASAKQCSPSFGIKRECRNFGSFITVHIKVRSSSHLVFGSNRARYINLCISLKPMS